jgi:translation initiation factor 2 subunit 1
MKAKTVASIMRHVASKVPSTAITETAEPVPDTDAPHPEAAAKIDADDKSTKKSRRAARKHVAADPEDPNITVVEDVAGGPTGGAGEEERLEQLYDQIAWPLGRKYGQPYDAFKLALKYVPLFTTAPRQLILLFQARRTQFSHRFHQFHPPRCQS